MKSHDSRNVPGDRIYDEACREVDELTPSVPPMARPVAKGWPPVRTNWYDALVGDGRGPWRYDATRDVVFEAFGRVIARKQWKLNVAKVIWLTRGR